MLIRQYKPDQDKQAVIRIWQESGWLSHDDDKKDNETIMEYFLCNRNALIAEIDGEAECLTISTPGTMRYLDTDLPLAAITAVTTSRIARKQGLASRVTAATIASEAANGAAIAGLGIFEQGYYNRLGFGADTYTHHIAFDPAQLNITDKPRVPKRLGKDDWQQIHQALLNRRRQHGACNLTTPEYTRAEIYSPSNNFGLGYFDGPDNQLSHFIWVAPKGEIGPYRIRLTVYQNRKQFLELMALIKSLSDQVRLVKMREPHDIQMQDLIRQPFRFRQATHKSEFENDMHSSAHSQSRICNLQKCIAATHLPGGELKFNLDLNDPIESALSPDSPWKGISGKYIITLGPTSSIEPGLDNSLPILKASVNAFTRLWLGVKPATSLTYTDDLHASDSLIEDLDNIIRLPRPQRDWDY